MVTRNHYHDYLKRMVEESGDEELKEGFYELEKQISSGKFYPPRVQKVREDIAKRVKEGKPQLSSRGLNLILAEGDANRHDEESKLTKKLKNS